MRYRNMRRRDASTPDEHYDAVGTQRHTTQTALLWCVTLAIQLGELAQTVLSVYALVLLVQGHIH